MPRLSHFHSTTFTVSLIIGLSVIYTSGTAQEAVASGNFRNADKLLSNRVDVLRTITEATANEVKNILLCNNKGGLYAPTNPEKDTDNCITPLQSLETKILSKSICTRGGVHEAIVECPDGWTRISCTGGSGDLLEDAEGTFIEPTEPNKCRLVVGNPACLTDAFWTYSWVFAQCVRLKQSH